MITRVALIFWVVPLALYTSWFVLSANDVNFGSIYLSRQMHDLVMQTYANLLGLDPDIIPALLIRAVIWDAAVVLCIVAFRRRKRIRAWWNERRRLRLAAQVDLPASEPTAASLALPQQGDPVERAL
ncbi:DUF6105 family protein [Notoacmeibacter marinus]|uniref:DUF6105 family protein n=1 Tax=Notoacmeibacter marinus TaxID=1876515 RepID=UPI001F0AF41A|nr:DUF6105 family protein [Notoacmeibacter marinus]